MILQRALLVLLFGCVFLFGLLVFAPASVMGYGLERITGGTLSLAQSTDSVWQGSGVLLLRQNTRYQSLGNFRWQLQLFSASLKVQSGDSAPMTVRYVPFSGNIDIKDLHLILPFSAVELAAPQLVPYQLQGALDAHSDHLTLDASGINGQVSVDWLHAASALSEIRPLGDYRIQLQGNGPALDAQITTLSGKLMLTGTGHYDNANGMRINGTAQAANPAAAKELNELLHHIGPEVSPGVFKLGLMPQQALR